ncbi:MAG: septation protein SpoVG family protein [Candidatus Omnitrophica bacterium]|nr:septation protein SpoVG family protein [Candidatus Omnitrophota bacterium]
MSEVVISEIIIYPVKPSSKGLVAFASCTFNNQLSLNSIAIYSRPSGDGFRLVYPSKQLLNGKEISTFYPINKVTGDQIHKSVINKLSELIDKYGEGRK